MASTHLTNDNGRAAFEADENHLAGVTFNYPHLVVVKQSTDWNAKQFIVTPTEKKFICADAWGHEAYPTTQGGAAVMNDTGQLITAVNSCMETASWNTGDKPIFSLFTRTYAPRCIYNEVYGPKYYSGVCMSAVALKFNLWHLHISKLTTFKIYIRAYIPSMLIWDDNSAYGIVLTSAPCNDSSILKVRFADELPENGSDIITEDSMSYNIYGNCNTSAGSPMVYDLYDQFQKDSTQCNDIPFRIYSKKMTKDGKEVAVSYYHDFEITDETALAYLKTNPGEFWLLARFNPGNAIAAPSQGLITYGLAPYHSMTIFIQRLELILECTKEHFNTI